MTFEGLVEIPIDRDQSEKRFYYDVRGPGPIVVEADGLPVRSGFNRLKGYVTVDPHWSSIMVKGNEDGRYSCLYSFRKEYRFGEQVNDDPPYEAPLKGNLMARMRQQIRSNSMALRRESFLGQNMSLYEVEDEDELMFEEEEKLKDYYKKKEEEEKATKASSDDSSDGDKPIADGTSDDQGGDDAG